VCGCVCVGVFECGCVCVCVNRWSGVNTNSKHELINMHGKNIKNASKCLSLSLKIADLSKIKQISYDGNNGSILVTLPRG
jgi:hypothetical protein